MNRFRTKKKAKEEAAPPRPSQESESSGPFRRFGKSKKSAEEPKKEINLATALPPSDDFRTSLLMTGLSARFSMLREQDDPNTKIGKASDDSVLFPKRQSRLMDYGFTGGLSDIAEVESIRAPPLFGRMDSVYSSDGESMSGSVMNRGKPTEGNNLFGGRQKIYKIPVGGGSSTKNVGGMGGRALYEDDVSVTAFQKWRQAEKERQSYEHQRNKLSAELNLELPRAESPSMTYNRKRETNSTTSSVPSVGRNSTAGTSFTSQPTPSIKDWQSTTTASNSASGTPVLERSVTRTRRLYETGLSSDLHEQQSSALSRIDNLSRQRTIGSRTPDSLQNTSSPTSSNFFNDRFGDRRPLAKASAPNLRSISPPTTGSSVGTMDLGIKEPNNTEQKHVYGGAPPLSPPISENEEYPVFPIQPNDRGKATAMGVFQKPMQAYDESKYAQRQLQLQQGRETPTNRFRAESNASHNTARSRSSSSAHRQPFEKSELSVLTQPTVKEESIGMSFLDDSDEAPLRFAPFLPIVALESPVKRPSDNEHPAFRESAAPTPLSINTKMYSEPSPISEKPELSASNSNSHQDSPEDSPTLGPNAGLSGMVRQHLRTDSNTSSVYGAAPNTSGMVSKFPVDPYQPGSFDDLDVPSNPWDSQAADWTTSYYGHLDTPEKKNPPIQERTERQAPRHAPEPTPDTRSSSDGEKEHDEFASQLADGARRVRERLTSYVVTDSRDTSPHSAESPRDHPVRDPPTSRPNPLGILKAKSSRGSLIDRNREPAAPSAKAMKMLGIGTTTMSTSPSPSRPSFEEKEPLPSMDEESPPPPTQEEQQLEEEKDENMHAGLRAFRQARRELQRLKEVEVQQRRHNAPPAPAPAPAPTSRTTPNRERMNRQRTPSRERKPPPVFYQSRAPSQESSDANSRNGSRPSSRTERDRSGSENSNNGRSHSRPARLRTASSPYEDRQLAPNSHARPAARSPGLPGTDIRRSPHMPPQPYPGAAPSPNYFDRSASSNNLNVQSRHRGFDSGQPSPISPLNGMPSPFLNSGNMNSPGLPSPRRPSAPPTPGLDSNSSVNRIDETMKRVVNKRDISEPTFVSSTSRVPTVNLPQTEDSGSRSRSDSNARSRSGSLMGATASTPNLHANHAPPLPPLNPKRRNMLGNFMGRRGEEDMSASTPYLPMSPLTGPGDYGDDNRSAFSISDDEDGKGSRERRKLRKATSEANGMNTRARHTRHGSPPYATTSAASPAVGAGRMPGGMI